MKIALPTRMNRIDEHFGHCEHFTVFTIDSGKQITAEEKIAELQTFYTQLQDLRKSCSSNTTIDHCQILKQLKATE